LGFIGLVSTEVFPLYVLDDAAHGGFGWKSTEIGVVAAIVGLPLILFQLFVYDRLVKCMGLLRFARFTFAGMGICFAITPLCSIFVKASYEMQWVVVATVYIFTSVLRVATFTCVFVFIANSALPADRGRVNGVGQAMVSAVRAVGPPIGTGKSFCLSRLASFAVIDQCTARSHFCLVRVRGKY
jgi:hypothetical protein